jgi:hypothetical protein
MVKEHGGLVLVLVLVLLMSWAGLLLWGWAAGPTSEEVGIVTVLEHVDGTFGSHKRDFRHLVKTESGAEYRMTFGEVYPVGTRLWVNYRRFTRGDTIKVTFYRRVTQ